MEITCKPSVTKRIVLRAAKAQRPIFIWGAPGIGKSDIVNGLAEYPGFGKCLVIDLRLALMEPTDLRGFPFHDSESHTMVWAPPADLPSAEQAADYDTIVLFMDELNSAPPSVQAAAYQLILNRRIGEYHLPDNCIMVAAGNRDTDKGVTYRMPSPLVNRFRHVNMVHDFDDWKDWALGRGIHPDILGYLSYDKSELFTFDPKAPQQVFATPRSWTYVDEILADPEFAKAPLQEQTAEIAGAIGEATARKFMEHQRIGKRLPRPEDIMDGTVTKLDEDLKKEIGVLYSLAVTLTYRINEQFKEFVEGGGQDDSVYKKSFNHSVRFCMKNMEAEMVMLLLKTLMKDYKVKVDIRKDLDKDISSEFHNRYVKYLVETS